MGWFSKLFAKKPVNGGLNTPERIYLESADVHLSRGERALAQGDLEKALLELKYAFIADNEAGRKNAKALAHLRGSVLGPLNTERTTKGQSLLDRGTQAQEQGDHARAVKLLTEAIDLCPVAAIPSFALRGKSNLALGRLKEAVSDLSVAIAYSPRVAEAYAERAKAFESLGDKQSAQRDYDKARSLLPN